MRNKLLVKLMDQNNILVLKNGIVEKEVSGLTIRKMVRKNIEWNP